MQGGVGGSTIRHLDWSERHARAGAYLGAVTGVMIGFGIGYFYTGFSVAGSLAKLLGWDIEIVRALMALPAIYSGWYTILSGQGDLDTWVNLYSSYATADT
jgi:hypothetical protein